MQTASQSGAQYRTNWVGMSTPRCVDCTGSLLDGVRQMQLSARAYHRILKLARTNTSSLHSRVRDCTRSVTE